MFAVQNKVSNSQTIKLSEKFGKLPSKNGAEQACRTAPIQDMKCQTEFSPDESYEIDSWVN